MLQAGCLVQTSAPTTKGRKLRFILMVYPAFTNEALENQVVVV
jgi:hypothetical protein